MKEIVWMCVLIAAVWLLPQEATAEEAKKTWVDKLQVSGDLRYRHEFISSEKYNSSSHGKARIYDRNRHRLRLRLAVQAKVNDRVDVFTRVASSTFANGAGDPISTNQDLGGGSTPKPIWIDRAFVEIRPLDGIAARVGRQPVPFEGTELLYDPDLNLEGIAALLARKVGGQELFLRAGGFWAAERGPDGYSKHALTQGHFQGQVGGKVKRNKLSGQIAVSYVDYGNVKNNPTVWTANNGYGNSLTAISGRGADTLGYLYDYNLLDVNAAAKLKLDRVEPAVVFDFLTNVAAKKDPAYDKKLNTGWLAGVSFRFVRMPFDWDVLYNYRVLQKDAVLGAYADSDPAGGGTNYNGHRFSVGAGLMPGVRLAGSYYVNTKDPDNKDSQRKLAYNRVQCDLEVKF
jgi:hypothetical protein